MDQTASGIICRSSIQLSEQLGKHIIEFMATNSPTRCLHELLRGLNQCCQLIQLSLERLRKYFRIENI